MHTCIECIWPSYRLMLQWILIVPLLQVLIKYLSDKSVIYRAYPDQKLRQIEYLSMFWSLLDYNNTSIFGTKSKVQYILFDWWFNTRWMCVEKSRVKNEYNRLWIRKTIHYLLNTSVLLFSYAAVYCEFLNNKNKRMLISPPFIIISMSAITCGTYAISMDITLLFEVSWSLLMMKCHYDHIDRYVKVYITWYYHH